MSFRSVVRGIVTGGVLGFLGGVLFAPKRGEEMRQELKDIVEKGKERSKDLSGKWNDLTGKLKEQFAAGENDEALDEKHV